MQLLDRILGPILPLLKPVPPARSKATALLASALNTPTRPRDFDLSLLQAAIEACPPDASSLPYRVALAHAHEDLGQLAEARATSVTTEHFLRQHNLQPPAAMLAGFVVDTAFYRRNPQSTATAWELAQQHAPATPTVDTHLAEACHHWLANRLEEANIAWRTARDLASTQPDCGAAAFTRDRIARLRAELDKAETIASAPAWLAGSFAKLEAIPAAPTSPSSASITIPTPAPLPALEVAEPVHPTTAAPFVERRRTPRNATPAGRSLWPRPEGA